MSQPNIILTGFMGTGKTTIGQMLAIKIGYQFVDTDARIEQQIGQTIAELFQTKGEATFRKLEAELVEELARQEGLVIATGGGLVLNPENVAALEITGKIICLTASAEEILARISNQPGVRPLLQEPDPQTKISELLQQRATIYQQFPQLSTSQLSPAELIDEILTLLQSP